MNEDLGLLRRLLVTTAVTALGTAGAALAVDAVRSLVRELGSGLVDLDSAVAALAGLALGALLLVWCAGAAAGLAAAAVGSASRAGAALQAVADATTPLLLRRLVAAAVGAAVLGGTAGPAVAAERPAAAASASSSVATPAAPASSASGPATDLAWPSAALPRAAARPSSPPAGSPTSSPVTSPAPVPTSAPVDPPAPDRAPQAPRGTAPAGAEVVVQRGDSLWSIAARHLPPGSSRAAVAASWPRWYAANRAVIGADPDVLRPGQRLVAP